MARSQPGRLVIGPTSASAWGRKRNRISFGAWMGSRVGHVADRSYRDCDWALSGPPRPRHQRGCPREDGPEYGVALARVRRRACHWRATAEPDRRGLRRNALVASKFRLGRTYTVWCCLELSSALTLLQAPARPVGFGLGLTSSRARPALWRHRHDFFRARSQRGRPRRPPTRSRSFQIRILGPGGHRNFRETTNDRGSFAARNLTVSRTSCVRAFARKKRYGSPEIHR